MPQASMLVTPVAAPLRQQILERLRNAIETGEFEPGQRLIERDLCERLGVSRPSVREALRQLEAERLIDILPNRGPIVRTIDRTEARAIYDVRAALESKAAELMAERGSDKQIGALRSALAAVVKAYSSTNVEAALASKARFYAALFDGAGNTVIPELLTNLHARAMVLRRLSLRGADRRRHSLAELTDIVDAISARNGARAAQAASHHVGRAAEAMLAALDEVPSSSGRK